MRRPAILILTLALLAGCASGPAGATVGSPDPAASAPDTGRTDIGAGLVGPAGLAAMVVATGLAHVSAFAFDADGRIWAATAGYDDDGSDGVYLVAASGATPRKVIAGLHTPLGLAWSGGTLFVASEGRVDAYRNLVDGAFASHTAILTLPAGVGEVNGLVLSPAGRLVLGVSAPCDACVPASRYDAAVLSFLPDGTDLRIEASGIRAPVGLAYDPGTSDLFVTMNQRDDLGDATPGDWLAIVRSGQAWGFPDCYGQGGSVCDGVPTPVAELDQHAAVGGVGIVTGQLGPSIGHAAVVTEWATGTVMLVSLATGAGATTGSAAPFLTGLTNPMPVAVTPDGAILIGDWATGTVYRIVAT